MKSILKICILLLILVICLLAEDFLARGVAIGVCIATIITGYMIGDRTSYSHFLIVIGYILGFIFYILSTLLEIHIDESGNHVKIISRFYTHTIAEGSKLETKKIPYGYSTEYGFVHGVESDDFKFVYTRNNTCIICSRYARMMELELPLIFIERDFDGYGYIQLIIDKRGQAFDFHGNLVDENYRPIKVDHTIPNPYPA